MSNGLFILRFFIYLLSSLFSICFIQIFFVLPFAVDLKLYLSSSLFPSDITSRAGSQLEKNKKFVRQSFLKKEKKKKKERTKRELEEGQRDVSSLDLSGHEVFQTEIHLLAVKRAECSSCSAAACELIFACLIRRMGIFSSFFLCTIFFSLSEREKKKWRRKKKVSGNTSPSDGVSFHWLLAKQTAAGWVVQSSGLGS